MASLLPILGKKMKFFSTIKDFSKSGVISFIKLKIVPYFAILDT